MSASSTYYELLGISPYASQQAVRKKYQQLILQYHPDKQKQLEQWNRSNATETAVAETEEHNKKMLNFLQEAWETLKQPDTRAAYNAKLGIGRGPITDDLDIEELDYDPEEKVYIWNCRCSGTFILSLADIEDGCELVPCTFCSLRIRVQYDPQEVLS